MPKTSLDVPTGVKPSVIKALPTGFREEADAMDEEDLRSVIITAEGSLRENEQEKAKHEELTAAKEVVKLLSQGYTEVSKAQKAKIAYALHRLDEIGKSA
jgi:hypothetical protein